MAAEPEATGLVAEVTVVEPAEPVMEPETEPKMDVAMEPEMEPAMKPEMEPKMDSDAAIAMESELKPGLKPAMDSPKKPRGKRRAKAIQLADASEPTTVEVREGIVSETTGTRYASALRRSTDDNVWMKRTIPFDELKGDKFLLTPNVGNVRVIFDGGESIDGRLHGVGAKKVVIDTKLGRMSLDARRADRIDRLGGGERAELRSPSDSYASTKGLDRVKVRAAGGVFYGFLVAKMDDRVTLMLEDGVRVTLESTEVETAKVRKSASRMRSR